MNEKYICFESSRWVLRRLEQPSLFEILYRLRPAFIRQIGLSIAMPYIIIVLTNFVIYSRYYVYDPSPE